MESSPRSIAVVIILLFIFFAPDGSQVQRLGRIDDERIAALRQADFDVLTNATYGELETTGLNLTGLLPEDNFQWQMLPEVKDLVRQQVAHTPNSKDTTVYRYINAEVRGNFVRKHLAIDPSRQVNLTALDPFGAYVNDYFQRNVTENEGEISITLEDSKIEAAVRPVRASLSLFTDSAPGSGWEAGLHGVHFADGSVVLTTGSRKFNALPALPQFALSEDKFNLSRTVMNRTVAKLWDRVFQNEGPLFSVPNCELIVWLTQQPLHGSAKYIEQIEKELKNPDGAPIGQPEPIAFSATVFSPDCGFVLEADAVFGPKAEAYWGLVQRLLLAFITIVALEIALLKRQMEKCATPSTRARISYYSIGIAAFGDGLILFAMIGLLMIEGGAFLLLAAASFLCCMHVALFEVKFIYDIWTVQVGEPAQAQAERDRRAAAAAAAATNATTPEGLPLPATARTNGTTPTNAIDPAFETPRTTFASLYSRFYFALINLMFFSLWAMSWPQGLRSAYINLLSFCYFSLWLPQIYRNVMRNCRRALEWEYVIGTSILRAIPVLYWYFDHKNLLSAKPGGPTAAFVLLAWLGMQVLVLVSQEFLGPRVLVKDSWCPPAYDYHPVLSNDLESGGVGMPIGELASAGEGKDNKESKARKLFDCAICMNEIDVPVISKDDNSGGTAGRSWGLMEQRNYMVTPCRHIFHTDCLEGWMNLRLVCPVCREGLPPL